MKPSNRDELVELMARHAFDDLYESGMLWDESHESFRQEFIKDAESALTALEQAGCAVVPVEATEEMRMQYDDLNWSFEAESCDTTWAAMLKAGPYARTE